MLDYLDSMCLRAKIRFLGFVNELRTGEAGVSAFVATVLLMVIVLSVREMSFICKPHSSPILTPVKSAIRIPAVFLFRFM